MVVVELRVTVVEDVVLRRGHSHLVAPHGELLGSSTCAPSFQVEVLVLLKVTVVPEVVSVELVVVVVRSWMGIRRPLNSWFSAFQHCTTCQRCLRGLEGCDHEAHVFLRGK